MSEEVIRNCPKCLSPQERIKNLESMLDAKVKDYGDLCVELSDALMDHRSLKTKVSQLEMHNQIMLDVLKEIMSWEENEETTWGAKARAAISLTFSGMDEPSEKDKAISQMVDALNYYATVGTKYGAIKLFNNPPDGEGVHVYEHIAKTALEFAKQAGLIKY